jgi:hypothetical protein
MIEFYILLSLLILLFISLLTNQTGMVLLGLLVIGLLGFRLLSSHRTNSPINKIRSLPWNGYWIPGLVLLVDAGILVIRQAVTPFHLGLLLAIGWIVILSRVISSWYQMGQPPPPARNLKTKAKADGIHVTWEPPNDPRYAENLLVRSPPTVAPTYPEQGEVLCRGLVSAWCDKKVEPGRSYAYMVFTHNGRGRYHSTPGRREYPLDQSDREQKGGNRNK